MIIKNTYKKKSVGLLLYDLDGTITYHDTLRGHYEAVLRTLGIIPKPEYIAEILKAVADFLVLHKEEGFTLAAFYKYNEEHLSFLIENDIKGSRFSQAGMDLEDRYLKLSAGMDVLIRYMAGIGIKQAIFTNWFRNIQINKLNKFNLLPYFSELYTPETLPIKPSLEGFKTILIKEGVKEGAVMIGDSSEDMAAGEAGFHTILLDPNGKKEALYEIANSVVTEANDIKKLLLK